MPPESPLEHLVAAYYGRIRRAAGLLSGCAWDADDLTQETFVRAAEAWPRFRGASDEFVWLYGILLNLDRSRRRRVVRWLRHQRHLLSRWLETAEPASGRSDDRDIWNAVHRLAPDRRQAVVLRYAEGWSYAQIARICECPETTARTRVHKGLRQLRDQLAGEPQDSAPPLTSVRPRSATGEPAV